MVRLAPINLLSASIVLVGGLLPPGWRLPVWALAFALQWISPYLHPSQTWPLSPSHFVERHGLVVIVALGESIVAIGVGAAGVPIHLELIIVAVLGLSLAYLLWWTYFGGDDAPERTFAGTAPQRRAMVAVHAFGDAHLVLLIGIVVLAAGVKKAIGHAFDHLPLALGGGVALFLVGDVWFRRALSIGRLRYRALAAIAPTRASSPEPPR
jgi:low temperature requirement protein LtrA